MNESTGELLQRLLEKAGFKLVPWNDEESWVKVGINEEPSYVSDNPPDLLGKVDACLEWLVPEDYSISFNRGKTGVVCMIDTPEARWFSGSALKGQEALALCRAMDMSYD